jgi:hypothetical protein
MLPEARPRAGRGPGRLDVRAGASERDVNQAVRFRTSLAIVESCMYEVPS